MFQWVNFDDEHTGPPSSFLDRSGYAHGAEADYNYTLTTQLSVGAEYDLRRANVGEIRTFDTQNAMGTVDYRLSPRYSLSAGAGLSWLHTSGIDDVRVRPPFASVSTAPASAWRGTSATASPFCRRLASAARSRTRSSRQGSSRRSLAASS